MQLYSVRTLSGPSLLCDKACVLATFYSAAIEAAGFQAYDKAVANRAIAETARLDITLDIAKGSSSVPPVILLITALIEQLMAELELDCGSAVITANQQGQAVNVAFPEKDCPLTSEVVVTAMAYVMDLYTAEQGQASDASSKHLLTLESICRSINVLARSGPTISFHDSLMEATIPWLKLDSDAQSKNMFQIGFGRQQYLFQGAVTFNSSQLGIATSFNKRKTRQFLSTLGFTFPKQVVLKNSQHACQVAEHIGYPVVLKSEVGTQGKLVHADLRDQQELVAAYSILEQKLKATKLSILLEQYIEGDTYRAEVINGEFFDAYEMIPAGVTGDGVHTISELVEIENTSPHRSDKMAAVVTFVNLEIGKEELQVLKKQGLLPDNIPASGQFVRLTATSNWSKGGTFKRAAHRVHPDNQRLFERIAAALSIDIIGIDLVTDDISQSFMEQPLHIIEVNHAPEVGSYYDINEGFLDLSKRILERFLPDGRYGDVPVIVFTSSVLSGDAAMHLSALLNRFGYATGLINDNGMVVDGQPWARPAQVDYKNPGLQLLRNSTVGAAVMDRTLTSLADFGLGHGGCDIAVNLEVSAQSLVTPVWTEGVAGADIQRFLSDSARLASIVLVEDAEGIALCQQARPDNQIALLLHDVAGVDDLLGSGVNSIRLIEEKADELLLAVSYKGKQMELAVPVYSTQTPVPSLLIVAVALVLGLDIESSAFTEV